MSSSLELWVPVLVGAFASVACDTGPVNEDPDGYYRFRSDGWQITINGATDDWKNDDARAKLRIETRDTDLEWDAYQWAGMLWVSVKNASEEEHLARAEGLSEVEVLVPLRKADDRDVYYFGWRGVILGRGPERIDVYTAIHTRGRVALELELSAPPGLDRAIAEGIFESLDITR